MNQFIRKLFPNTKECEISDSRSKVFSTIFNSALWVIIIAVTLACTAIFHYYDYADTLDNAIMLGESILDGKFTEYYTHAAENAAPQTIYTANYNVFLYGIFLIWNLPTFFLHRANGFDYMNSAKALVWCKLLIVLSVVAVCIALYKILSLYVEKKKFRNLGLLLFFASTCTVVPAFVVGQYDSFSLFFMLLGIYYYLKGNERLFILFFAIAMPLKYFALFIFIPLLLLKEKNILFIFIKTVPLFVIQFVCGLPFGNDEWYDIAMGLQNRDALSLITGSTVTIAGFSFNLFIIAFLVIAILCYVKKHSKEDGVYLPLYVSFATMSAFTVLTALRSYWIILLVPFAVLVLFFNRSHLRANVLLFTVSTVCYSVYAVMTHWIYNMPDFAFFLALPRVMELPDRATLKYGAVSEFFAYHDLQKYSGLIYSVFAAGIILLLIINFPKITSVKAWETEELKFEILLPVFQVIVSGAFVALLLYANLATAGYNVYSVSVSNSTVSSTDLIGAQITQTFVAAEDDSIEQFTFRAENLAATRKNRNIIRFELIDKESGEILVSESVGAGEIQNNVNFRINFPKVELNAGREYIIKLSGEHERYFSPASVKLYVSSSLVYPEHPMTVNGEVTSSNLVGTLK